MTAGAQTDVDRVLGLLGSPRAAKAGGLTGGQIAWELGWPAGDIVRVRRAVEAAGVQIVEAEPYDPPASTGRYRLHPGRLDAVDPEACEWAPDGLHCRCWLCDRRARCCFCGRSNT